MNDDLHASENPYENTTFNDVQNVNVFAVAGVIVLALATCLGLLCMGLIGIWTLVVSGVLSDGWAGLVFVVYAVFATVLPALGARSLFAWLKTQ